MISKIPFKVYPWTFVDCIRRGNLVLSVGLSVFCSVLFSLLILDPTWARPTAGEVALMKAKKSEVEYTARQRIETVFARLCPGRCEVMDVRADISPPKPVGQVLPGFDTPNL